MAISTFSGLKTAIASWVHRDDLTSLIPDFIRLAEVRIARTFVPRGNETEDELVTVADSRYVVLPTSMSRPVGLWLKADTPRTELPQRLPSELVVTTTTGYPEYWAIDGTNIAFDKPATSAWAFDFRYLAPFALSDSVTTNYVLDSTPDLYLWGALSEAFMYALDAANAGIYEQRYQSALRDAQSRENDSRTVELQTEFGSYGGRANILRGY